MVGPQGVEPCPNDYESFAITTLARGPNSVIGLTLIF